MQSKGKAASAPRPQDIAVVGAGVAGAACARGLIDAGHRVTAFERSAKVGGRMATRPAQWLDAQGHVRAVSFDHGAPAIEASTPRFAAALARAEAEGVLRRWLPRVHTDGLSRRVGERFVAQPGMPALVRHWLADLPVRTRHTVQRLSRHQGGWMLHFDDAIAAGPFDQVVLALPPANAATLLIGQHDGWAQSLLALRMQPCWTLMAVTDDVDWPWDAAEPARGPLRLVLRHDRKPGREAPPGCASWVAHATASWSAAHLEEPAAAVTDALIGALQSLLPPTSSGLQALRWHHAAAHRWRYALPTAATLDPWWDASLGLAVCGDALGGDGVEGAWRSGDELADRMAAELEQSAAQAVVNA